MKINTTFEFCATFDYNQSDSQVTVEYILYMIRKCSVCISYVFFPYKVCFWDFHLKIKCIRIGNTSKHSSEAKNLKTYYKYSHVQKSNNIHCVFWCKKTIKQEKNQTKKWLSQSYFSPCKLTFKSMDKAIL